MISFHSDNIDRSILTTPTSNSNTSSNAFEREREKEILKSCSSHTTVETVMRKRVLNFTASFVGISGFRKEVGVFTSSSVIDEAWSLRIYPGGYDDASSGFVSCYVSYHGTTNPSARAAFKLSVINQKGWKNRQYVSDVKEFFTGDDCDGHGDKQFISKSDLKLCGNGIISNDSLAIRVDLMVYGEVEHSIKRKKWSTTYTSPLHHTNSRTSTPTRNSQNSEHLNFDWGCEDTEASNNASASANLIGCLASLIDDPTMSDVTIIIEGCQRNEMSSEDLEKASQAEIAAHKLLLCSRSPVFKAMLLNGQMLESSSSEIHVTDISAAVMRSLIYYIYTGQCTTSDMEIYAEELLAAAAKYQIKELMTYCEQYLCDNMTVKNASNNLFLGDLYDAQLLKQHSLVFISQHAKTCITGSFFETLSFPLCQEVIKCLAGIDPE